MTLMGCTVPRLITNNNGGGGGGGEPGRPLLPAACASNCPGDACNICARLCKMALHAP